MKQLQKGLISEMKQKQVLFQGIVIKNDVWLQWYHFLLQQVCAHPVSKFEVAFTEDFGTIVVLAESK